MRIIAGTARGAIIQCPKGRAVRPTADRVREALFNIIGAQVEEAMVLDLFAGAGTLGIEALSRGASRCVFVEKDRACARMIEANLARTRLLHKGAVVVCDVFRSLPRLRRSMMQFNLLLCDPPYTLTKRSEQCDRLLAFLDALAKEGLTQPEACLVWEHAARGLWPPGSGLWRLRDRRRYGDTSLAFFDLVRPEG